MKASEKAKAIGLKSLDQVVKLTETSKQTLNNWHNHKPKLFDIVILGCKAKIEAGNERENDSA